MKFFEKSLALKAREADEVVGNMGWRICRLGLGGGIYET